MNKKSDILQYYVDSDESLFNRRNQVRNLINDSHWQKEGEYKEALLKEILEEKLHGTKYHVGTGFIIDKEKQIDILIFEKNPTHIFQFHDFYIVDVNSVRAVIEVETRIEDSSDFEDVILETNKIGNFISENRSIYMTDCFIGVFSYEGYDKIKYSKEKLRKRFETVFHKQKIRESITEGGVNFINLNRDIIIERKSIELTIYKLEKQSYSYYIESLCDFLIDEKFRRRITVTDRPHTPNPIKVKSFFKISLSEYSIVD